MHPHSQLRNAHCAACQLVDASVRDIKMRKQLCTINIFSTPPPSLPALPHPLCIPVFGVGPFIRSNAMAARIGPVRPSGLTKGIVPIHTTRPGSNRSLTLHVFKCIALAEPSIAIFISWNNSRRRRLCSFFICSRCQRANEKRTVHRIIGRESSGAYFGV